MNNCTHCGAPLDGTANFCTHCGENLDKGKSLALSAKTPSAGFANKQAAPVANETATSATSQALTASVTSQNPTITGRKKLAILISAGAAVLALALVLIFTVFLNKPQTERPLTVAELLDLGEKYLLDLDYEQALVQFMAVVEIEPKNERAYTGAAEAYIGLGNKDGAAEILWEGYEKTSSTEIWHMIGEVAAEQEASVETAPEPTPELTITENETETSPVPSAQVGDIIEFGGYDWRVLDVQDDKVLVISEYVLREHRPFNYEFGSNTWEESSIRTYLNGEYYDSFNDIDKMCITHTQVINSDNPWFGTNGGADTQDYIFLLSIGEVVQYFGDGGQLVNRTFGGIRDEYNEARIAYTIHDNSKASAWLLRSPGDEFCTVAFVNHDGGVSVAGTINDFPDGVRPAMWLNLG